MRTKREISIVLTAVLFLIVGFSYWYRPQLVAVYIAHKLKRDAPLIDMLPSKLVDYSSDNSPGTLISGYGYEFEVPWSDLERTEKKAVVERVVFKSGRVIVFFDPKQQPDFVAILKNTKPHGKLEAVIGENVLRSNYELSRAALYIDTRKVSLWMSRKIATQTFVLLMAKFGELHGAETGILDVQTRIVRGFQTGDPARGARAVRLSLFDSADHNFCIWLFKGNEPAAKALTQAEVNRVIASLRPTPETTP